MDQLAELSLTERYLLLAAYVLKMGPATDLSTANTNRVFVQALRWSGVHDEDIRIECDDPNPICVDTYQVLIDMVQTGRRPEMTGRALFEGGGNWGRPGDAAQPACWPRYNSCRLTEYGWHIASQLITHHPECA